MSTPVGMESILEYHPYYTVVLTKVPESGFRTVFGG